MVVCGPSLVFSFGPKLNNIASTRELYVIVEYCKYGNLQKYITSKRDTFISQVNPVSGRYDDQYPPEIATLLQGHDR